jgi:hypothetical protein
MVPRDGHDRRLSPCRRIWALAELGTPYWFTTSSTNKASFFLFNVDWTFVYLAQITTLQKSVIKAQ